MTDKVAATPKEGCEVAIIMINAMLLGVKYTPEMLKEVRREIRESMNERQME